MSGLSQRLSSRRTAGVAASASAFQLLFPSCFPMFFSKTHQVGCLAAVSAGAIYDVTSRWASAWGEKSTAVTVARNDDEWMEVLHRERRSNKSFIIIYNTYLSIMLIYVNLICI